MGTSTSSLLEILPTWLSFAVALAALGFGIWLGLRSVRLGERSAHAADESAQAAREAPKHRGCPLSLRERISVGGGWRGSASW